MDIMKVQYDGETTFIKFKDTHDAIYSLKCKELPRPELPNTLKSIANAIKTWTRNPVSDAKLSMTLQSVEYKYKADAMESFKFDLLISAPQKMAADMIISNILYPCDNETINTLLIRLNEEANQYIKGHRAQMGLFTKEGES